MAASVDWFSSSGPEEWRELGSPACLPARVALRPGLAPGAMDETFARAAMPARVRAQGAPIHAVARAEPAKAASDPE